MSIDDEFNRRFPWWSYGRTKKVEGGIKARATRFGESWWSAAWLDAVLSNAGSSNRLARGRSYARKGQITDFTVRSGKITGAVQGSADTPYAVEITAPVVSKDAGGRILRSMQRSPLFAARLLNQEMPREVVNLFEQEDENLFPDPRHDLKTNCSCPDYETVCKHLAALFYLFSLELERDPLLLLQFRGIDRERLLSEVRTGDLFAGIVDERKEEPLSAEPVVYWRGSRIPPSSLTSNRPERNAMLVKQLGSFPLWRGENDLMKILESIYDTATSRAQKYFGND
jgi:uncharacterized Zn finger protein